ncbi:MAG: DUF1592 domain-containing protein [Myxococcota bacterium]
MVIVLMGCEGQLSEPSTPGDPPPPGQRAPVGEPPAPSSLAPRLVRLTPRQLENTLRTIVDDIALEERLSASAQLGSGFGSSGAFSTAAGRRHLTEPHVRDIYDAMEDAALRLAEDPAALASCLAGGLDDASCIETFVADFGARAWRRPVSTEERDRFVATWTSAREDGSPEEAFPVLVRAMLMSPAFLFRSEFGEAGAESTDVALEPYELASALSYVLADGPPDRTLRDLAAAGDLAAPTTVEAEARRLLAGRETASGVVAFLAELFDVAQVRAVVKDPDLYPDFDPALTRAMERESTLFLADVLIDGDARLGTMLTASYSFVDDRLAAIYGVDPPSEPFGRVDLDPAERFGVLTQPAFLAAHAHPDETSIVFRGRFVRFALLCEDSPPPPEDVDANLPPRNRDEVTLRDHTEEAHSVGSCAGCHSLMDPIGYAFERYDTVGRYRTEDHGLPIDPSGQIVGGELPRTFDDAQGLVDLLAESEDVTSCVARRFVQYALGTEPPIDDPLVVRATAAFQESGGSVRELAVAVVTDEAFRVRRRP